MISLKRGLRPCAVIYLLLLVAAQVLAQQKREITVDWIYGEEAGRVSALPAHAWLADGTAIIYDLRQPAEQRRLT